MVKVARWIWEVESVEMEDGLYGRWRWMKWSGGDEGDGEVECGPVVWKRDGDGGKVEDGIVDSAAVDGWGMEGVSAARWCGRGLEKWRR